MNTATNSTTNDDPDAVNLDGMNKAAGGRKKVNNLPKLKDGVPYIGRVLPPFGPKANGVPFAIWWLHWWRRDGDKKGRPVACSKSTDKAGCPICDEVKGLYETYDKLLEAYASGSGRDRKIDFKRVPKEVKSKTDELMERIRSIKAERKYYYNMMLPDGTVGVFACSMTLGEKINDKIKSCIQKMGFNPVSRKEGAFFSMKRSKDPSDKYQFDVEVASTPVKGANGKTTLELMQGPLPEAVIANFDSLMIDVHDLYKRRTAAEIKKFMTADPASFDPEEFAGDEGDEEPAEKPATAAAPADTALAGGASEEDLDALADELGLDQAE